MLDRLRHVAMGWVGVLAGGSCGIDADGACWMPALGPETVSATDLVVDGEDNLYVIGQGAIEAGALATEADFFINKYDAAGALLWTRQFGDPGLFAQDIVETDRQGDAYVIGLGHDAGGAAAIVVNKFDGDGAPQWRRMFGLGDALDDASAAAVDGQGSVYVVGAVDATPYARDPFLARLDRDGNVLWAQPFGRPLSSAADAVAIDGDDNIYVAGHTRRDADDHTNQDAFLSKFDPSGAVLWTRQTDSDHVEQVRALMVDAEDNVFVAAEWLALGVVFKYDPSGAQLWRRELSDYQVGPVHMTSDGRGDVNVAMARTGSTAGECAAPIESSEGCGARPVADRDIVVVAYDASGSPAWERVVSGAGEEDDGFHDEPRAVTTDREGGVYVAGTRTVGQEHDALVARVCPP